MKFGTYSTIRALKLIFQFLKESNMASIFAVFVNFEITICHISESIQPILMKFGTHVALVRSLKLECFSFWKNSNMAANFAGFFFKFEIMILSMSFLFVYLTFKHFKYKLNRIQTLKRSAI